MSFGDVRPDGIIEGTEGLGGGAVELRHMATMGAMYLNEEHGTAIDGRTLYEWHPGGELYPVFDVFRAALKHYGRRRAEQCIDILRAIEQHVRLK